MKEGRHKRLRLSPWEGGEKVQACLCLAQEAKANTRWEGSAGSGALGADSDEQPEGSRQGRTTPPLPPKEEQEHA